MFVSRLRAATHEAHGVLERELNLLQPPLTEARFRRVLARFERFHRAWEPAVGRLIADERFLAPRRRLCAVRADLAAIGARLDAGPGPDLAFLSDASAAWGSLYVVEGSTLGGQVISKALSGAAWAPAGGLHYFNPHGRRTAEVWRETLQAIEAHVLVCGEEGVIAGAVSTFALLTGWIAPGLAPASEETR